MTDMNILICSKDTKDMKPVIKKPVIVHALQINEPFYVDSLEGIVKGKSGDYLMKGASGELYICDKTIFEQTYEYV